jgi:hypothetical protein
VLSVTSVAVDSTISFADPSFDDRASFSCEDHKYHMPHNFLDIENLEQLILQTQKAEAANCIPVPDHAPLPLLQQLNMEPSFYICKHPNFSKGDG